MEFTSPSTSQFQAWFFRDFPYGTDPTVSVTDQDIANAYTLVNMTINPSLFGDQTSYTTGYLYLAAHYLVMNIRAGGQGLNGQFAWLEQSKSVGSVSQAFGIPQRILDNPEMAALCKTNYGAQYLTILLPLLSGQVFTVRGHTKA